LFLGFDGSTAWGPPGSTNDVKLMREVSFISQIRQQLMVMGEKTEYWDGPWATSFGVDGIYIQGLDYFLTNIDDCSNRGLVLAGYSRGAFIAACLNRKIQEFVTLANKALNSENPHGSQDTKLFELVTAVREQADRVRKNWGGNAAGFTPINNFPKLDDEFIRKIANVQVDGLLLLDPVKRILGNNIGHPNVVAKKALHVRRSRKAMSRSQFGFVEKSESTHIFYATHAAMGGLPGTSIDPKISFFARDKCMVTARKDEIVSHQIAELINNWFSGELRRNINVRSLLQVEKRDQNWKDLYIALCGY
jgi:hypothetical protein